MGSVYLPPKDVARLTLKPLNYIYLLLHKSNRFIRIEMGFTV